MKRVKKSMSVRSILGIVSAGTLLAYFLLNLLMSSLFMEKFYLKQTEKQLIQAYKTVLEHPDGDIQIMSQLENNNFRILQVNIKTNSVIYNSRVDDRLLPFMIEHMVDQVTGLLTDENRQYILSINEDHEITTAGTQIEMGNSVFLGGWIGENCIVQITAQLEPLKNAAHIASQFTILTGVLLLAVTFMVYSHLSKQIVRPLEDMTYVAGRIAKLDFSRRCSEVTANELGQLSHSINEMSDTMQQYIDELRRANEQLRRDIQEKERSEEARRSLVDNLSHDLKTPIALISGYAEGLGSGMAKTPEMVREYCDVIVDESNRMLEMITRMLTFSRLESGVIELQPEVFCLSDLLDDLLDVYALKLDSDNITLEKYYHSDCYVNCDYVSAEQALTNYIQNAMTHLSGSRRVVVCVREWREYYRISVYNTAPPITSEQQKKIWNSFFRGETSRHRRGCETGLGLAIVRSNMELMHLPYGMENASDGVIFWICLPMA